MNTVLLNPDREDTSLDPLDGRQVDFDWAGLFHSIGEDGPEVAAEVRREAMSIAAQAIRELLRWQVGPFAQRNFGKRVKTVTSLIARRVLALAWALDPVLVDGSPSLRKLARQMQCHKMAIGEPSSAARHRFRLRNRSGDHAWNFGKKRLPQPTDKATIAKASFRKPKRKPKRR